MKERIEALDRLKAIAKSDTGQADRGASFLLTWWNASELGGFALKFWAVDDAIVQGHSLLKSRYKRNESERNENVKKRTF